MGLLMLPCEAMYATSESAFYAKRKKKENITFDHKLYQENEQNMISFQFPLIKKNTTIDPWAILPT